MHFWSLDSKKFFKMQFLP